MHFIGDVFQCLTLILHRDFYFAFRHEEKFWSTQYIPEFFDKEKQYQLEISQYKNTIKELTESQRDRNDLRRNNEMLQEELSKMRNEKEALMTTSVAVCEGKLKYAWFWSWNKNGRGCL